jgi:hypothetical protein
MATQRNKSYDPLIKVINGQLSLKDAITIINNKALVIYK